MKSYGLGIVVLLAACSGRTETIRQQPEPLVKQEAVATKVRDSPPAFLPDSAGVALAFRLLTEDPAFKKEAEEDGASVYDPELAPLIGDINHDGLADALKPFTLEGHGGGNNWTAHYAIFINKDHKLVFSHIFNRGGDWAERIITFIAIKNNMLLGYEEPNNKFPELDTIPVRYIYKDKDLVQISKQ